MELVQRLKTKSGGRNQESIIHVGEGDGCTTKGKTNPQTTIEEEVAALHHTIK